MSYFISKDPLLCLLFSDECEEIDSGIEELRSLELQSISNCIQTICLEMPTSSEEWYAQLKNPILFESSSARVDA